MYERQTRQDEANGDETTIDPSAVGSEASVGAFLTEHRAVVREYADGDYSTAWLNEALLSWAECDGQTNEVTEQ